MKLKYVVLADLFIMLSVCLLLLTSCSVNSHLEALNKEFPGAEIVFVPTHDSDFIVRTSDGAVWYVRCDNPVSPGSTSKSIILPAPKK